MRTSDANTTFKDQYLFLKWNWFLYSFWEIMVFHWKWKIEALNTDFFLFWGSFIKILHLKYYKLLHRVHMIKYLMKFLSMLFERPSNVALFSFAIFYFYLFIFLWNSLYKGQYVLVHASTRHYAPVRAGARQYAQFKDF